MYCTFARANWSCSILYIATKVDRGILDSDKITYDHAKMIEYAIDRLRNKIEYADARGIKSHPLSSKSDKI